MTAPDRLFVRLAPGVRAGDVVELDGWPGRWKVETAKVADDLKDSKCVVVRVAGEGIV